MKEKNFEISKVEINKLQGSISLYNRNLQRYPQNSQTHYMKAKDLFELGKMMPDKSEYFKQSLESYNKAIELEPKSALYYTKRGELHAYMGNTELAAEDIKVSNKFPASNDIASIYMQNTKRDIAKLTSVQEAINKLKAEGQINSVLAEAFLEHTKVTEGLVVSVGVHGETLDLHNGRIERLESMLAQLTQNFTKSEEERKLLEIKLTEQLKKETAEIKGELVGHIGKIGEIEARIVTLRSSTDFEELAKKLSNLEVKESLFAGRLKVAEGRLDDHDELLININDTLKQTNIYKEQEIKEGFEQLRIVVPNEVLYKYANSFHWSLSNYLLAYRAISTGLVDGVREKGKFEKVWNKVGGTVMNAVGVMPGVGNILPLIESGLSLINNTYQDLKFDRKVEKINSIITQSVLEKDLSLAVASSAIQIAKVRQDEIIKHEKAKQQSLLDSQLANKPIDKMMIRFNEEMDKLLTKVAKVSKTELTPAQEMAIKDVILFINYIATHDDAITIMGNGQNLDKAIAEVVCNHALLQAPQNQNQGNFQSGNKKSNDCIVCKADQFTYDNELLNHPELLREALKYYHYSSKILDLPQGLSQDLVGQIIDNQDSELLLAGLMSVEHDSTLSSIP